MDDRTLSDAAISTLDNPGPEVLGSSTDSFLSRLGGPTWLRIRGRDRSRCRAVVTLLHGNEPSGVRALHGLLSAGIQPATNVVALIGAVATATGPPPFRRRAKPEFRDLNRCFRPPYAGEEGRVAKAVLARLRDARPEALIDLHNTSGASPAYAVSTRLDEPRIALTTGFAEHLVVSDQRLGALVEATEDDFPTVVIECGGSRDPESDEIARRGLETYWTAEEVLATRGREVGVLFHPIRVEVREGARVAVAESKVPSFDVTLRTGVERHNFGLLQPGDVLGWLGPRGLAALGALDGKGRDRTEELFRERDGCLEVARPLRPLMVTTDPEIATSDCLFYVVEAQAVSSRREAGG